MHGVDVSLQLGVREALDLVVDELFRGGPAETVQAGSILLRLIADIGQVNTVSRILRQELFGSPGRR